MGKKWDTNYQTFESFFKSMKTYHLKYVIRYSLWTDSIMGNLYENINNMSQNKKYQFFDLSINCMQILSEGLFFIFQNFLHSC